MPDKPQIREIATIKGRKDITRGYIGPLLDPQDSVLRQQRFNYEIYEELLRDDQVKACLQQRRSAVTSSEYEVSPGGEKRIDKVAADFIRDLLETIGWDNIVDKQLFGIYYGYAVAECIWANDGGKITLSSLLVRKQRRFRFDWDMQPRLITWDNTLEGEILPPKKFWHYRTGADNDDEPYGLGLAHWLYWPVFFKREGMRSWLKFLEKFATPTAKGTYGPQASADEKARLKAALMAFGEDAAITIPEGVQIELLEVAKTGAADYSVLCDRMDAAIAKIILSQTMTTDNGSSRSQAEVHNGVKLEVVKADADLIDSSANRTWVRWLTDWNFPGAAYPKISRKLEVLEDLNARSIRDKTLGDMGFRLTAEKVVEVYGEGYYDPSTIKEEAGGKPPLVSVLGLGGTEALVGFLQQLSQMGLSRENAIATLITVFGISEIDAKAMMPEDKKEEPKKQSLLNSLFVGDSPTPKGSQPDPTAGDFAESVNFSAGGPNCNPAKSHLCVGRTGKGSCVSLRKKCKVPATGAVATASKYTGQKVKSTKTPAVQPVKTQIKLNQTELDSKRSDLESKYGKKLVADAEANVKKILTDADTSVYVRIGSSETLAAILGDRFRTSAELNITSHKIPHLPDKNYQDARNRVEAKTLGYDANTSAGDRPIYGYLGGKNMEGSAHNDASDAYGSIAVKLKSEVKGRTSFTGADSFKSGIASKLDDPSAASLASVTRFGYELDDKKVPSFLGSASQRAQKRQLQKAATAKGVDDLNDLAPTGNKYIEAQVHGKVTPDDIAEIHFRPRSTDDLPTAAIAKLAKDKGIDLYVDGKKINPDDLIPKPMRSQRLTELDDELTKALKSGDFGKLGDLAIKIDKDAKKVKLAPRETDKHLKLLYAESGYDGKPSVVNKAGIDKAAADGATLMVRGLDDSSGKFSQQFRTGDYYTGNGIYGNGTYVGHSGAIRNGVFTHGNDAASGKRAAADVIKNGYISSTTKNLRMALPSDAQVVTQSQLDQEIAEVKKGIETWAKTELSKLTQGNGSVDQAKRSEINKKAAALRKVLIGDYHKPPSSSGRFAVIRGHDAIALDMSYAKNTFMNLLNRSKVLVQDTDLSYADAMDKGASA